MPSMADFAHVNHDKTASNIPSRWGGLEACTGAAGYAGLVIGPIVFFIGLLVALGKCIAAPFIKRRQKKKADEEEAEKAANGTAGEEGEDSKPKKRPAKPPPDPQVLKTDPRNPRVCDRECPGYKASQGACEMHSRPDPDRPTSPGLLAV